MLSRAAAAAQRIVVGNDPNNLSGESPNESGSSEDENEIMAFEDENGADKTNALSDALKALANHKFNEPELQYWFNRAEILMAAAGVKKNFTKLQVISTCLPPHVNSEVRYLLSMAESEFPENDAYKQLKTQVLTIFGPKRDKMIEDALNLTLTGKPSVLARALVNKICKHNLECDCCPDIILCLWKRHLSTTVRAGIAHLKFNKETFAQVVQLADDIHADANPSANLKTYPVAAVQADNLDETQPAIPYASQEVAAIRGSSGRGSGRGGGGRGNRGNRGGGRGRGGGGGQGQGRGGRRGTRHPDGPPDSACSMHFRWGKSSHFCTDPLNCPWKDFIAPKDKNQ